MTLTSVSTWTFQGMSVTKRLTDSGWVASLLEPKKAVPTMWRPPETPGKVAKLRRYGGPICALGGYADHVERFWNVS